MSLWIEKFIKKVVYSKDEITICIYYRENFGEEAAKNDASGWVRAATGKDTNPDFNKENLTSTGRGNSCGCICWLPGQDSNLQHFG